MDKKLEQSLQDTALKRLIELGVDVENGVIPLVGIVDDDLYKHMLECIMQMTNANLEYPEITVLLNTYGGETYHAFAIYDLLKHQEMSVRIVCNGPVMSAGTIILMAGDIREMSPLSSLMVHYGWNSQENNADLEQNKKIVRQMKKLYKENSDADAKTISEWFSNDTYFTAKQALSIGMIDKVRHYAKKARRKKKSATRTRK